MGIVSLMKVCVDVQSAVMQRAGVGRYTRCLVRHMAPLATAAGDAMRLVYFDTSRYQSFDVPGAQWRPVRWISGGKVRSAWKRLGWPPYDFYAGAADVYHFPNFIRPPLRKGRSVVTIHDLSFERFPQFAEKRNLAYLRKYIRDTVARVDHVLTDSDFGAREIEELLGVPPERVSAIHLGIEPSFVPATPEAVADARRRYGLDRPYLLTVGTIEPRKNLSFLLDVFDALPEFDGLLAIAGMRGWKFEPILERMKNARRSRAIRCIDYVPDVDLPALYGGAEAFVLTSHYEGFGFPPLEAMACGAPVVSSAGGSLREVLGDGARLVDAFDVDAWRAALNAVLGSPETRRQLTAAGRARAARYTWEETARRTYGVYRMLAT